jgi:hypothetical protein
MGNFYHEHKFRKKLKKMDQHNLLLQDVPFSTKQSLPCVNINTRNNDMCQSLVDQSTVDGC